jgi:hypothetical protein
MRPLRERLTYANVISTIALFLALSGGAVYAASKIRSGDIAANAIKSKQIAPKAVTPADMATPVQFVARAQGGAANFPSAPGNYPLTGKTSWTQGAKQVDQFFVRATGTVAPSGGSFMICFASVTVKAGDQPVGTILFTGTGAQTQTGSGVLLDTGSKAKQKLTATVQGSNCDPGSHVDSLVVRGIGTG